MKFRQFLELKYLEWQQQSGGRKTVEEFADHLGIGRTTLSMWLNKNERVPQGDNIRKLADKLGLDVYHEQTAQHQANRQHLLAFATQSTDDILNWIIHDDPATVNHLLTALCQTIQITPRYELNIVWR